jgi:hypothetical protein
MICFFWQGHFRRAMALQALGRDADATLAFDEGMQLLSIFDVFALLLQRGSPVSRLKKCRSKTLHAS